MFLKRGFSTLLHVARIFAALLLLTASSQAFAVSLVTSPGGDTLLGVNQLVVGSNTWNVTFVDDSCNNLFTNCVPSEYAFSDIPSAQAAADELLGVLDASAFAMQPNSVFGCQSGSCGMYTPFSISNSGTSVRTLGAVIRTTGMNDTGITNFGFATDLASNGGSVYAVWTPAPVPLPAAAWLFISGLAGLFGAKKFRSS